MKRREAFQDPVFSDPVIASRYADKHAAMERRFGEEYARKLRARGFKEGRILDAGCGFGETLITLAKRLPDVQLSGVDLSDPLLELAGSGVRQAGLSGRIELRKADVCSMPFPDKHFDAVLNINMVHLVDRPVQMLDELERVLAAKGHLYIADIRRSCIGFLEREFLLALTVEEAAQLLRRSSIRQGELTAGLLWWRYES
jgi:ubiquinone/menaquinone biosynthesis C-methylase UbiE